MIEPLEVAKCEICFAGFLRLLLEVSHSLDGCEVVRISMKEPTGIVSGDKKAHMDGCAKWSSSQFLGRLTAAVPFNCA